MVEKSKTHQKNFPKDTNSHSREREKDCSSNLLPINLMKTRRVEHNHFLLPPPNSLVDEQTLPAFAKETAEHWEVTYYRDGFSDSVVSVDLR
ncbi:hypothetical protein CDAR_114311 [Caerostris darwini]|uniref:Uncharacterized protein n=1 Tax=Caerostris darwini TaxID=1538125 RepID=A0AAV4M940_9ARAC|nr:hypothetical protein CDAR_114311 [Caerostris darwini]